MSISWSDVVAIAGELTASAVASGTQAYALATADRQVDSDIWGEFADDGKRFLAAHIATLADSGSGGAAGPVVSETLGPMSRSYASLSSGDGDSLSQTKYGREYLRLLRLAIAVPALVP